MKMMETKGNVFWGLVVLCAVAGVNSLPKELYGASVHWKPNGTDSIVLSYRLVWDRSLCGVNGKWSGENCYKYSFLTGNHSVITVQNKFKGYKWQFKAGNVTGDTDLSDLYFTDIGVLHEIAYETGVGITKLTFGTNADTANIKLSFLDDYGAIVDSIGEARITMATRNDTQRANISPLLNVFPVYRIPLGCSYIIRLFPFDGDGDYVKCHWLKFPKKTQKELNVVLEEDKCEIAVNADPKMFQTGDKLQISLYAEDYSRFPVKFSGVSNDVSSGPFGRTPVTLMVYIGNATGSLRDCNSGPTFTKQGIAKQYYKNSYSLPFKSGLVKIPFETSGEKDRILTTGPRYMIFGQRRNGSLIEEGVWNNLTDPTMKGIHQACGAAYTDDGIPGESRCAVLMVNDIDECNPNPCTRLAGGICDNLFDYNTCTYPGDPTYYDGCKWTGACEPETIVEKADDNLGVNVGVPVGVSLLLLLIIVGVTMYLKRYWTEKFKNSVVEPETAVNGMANGVRDSIQH